MLLPSLSKDVLWDILEFLSFEDIISLSLVCRTLYTEILEDRFLWRFILDRDFGHKFSCLPTNVVPVQDAPVSILRAWTKHAYALKRAYQHPNLDRTITRLDTPARVTFVKLVRGRWFLVASSNTAISELSVWEVLSPSACTLRNRIHFPAPILDGILDDGGDYIRLAVSVASCRPSIRVLELMKRSDGNVVLRQRAEIEDASRVLYLKDSILFFACLRGDDTWPTMTNWMNDGMIQLSYLGRGGMGDPFPLTLEHCAGLFVWRSYILVFAYLGLHIFALPDSIPDGTTQITPIISLVLPNPIFKITFLDECAETDVDNRIITKIRWVAQLANTNIVILNLDCAEEENMSSRFRVDVIFNTQIWDKDSNRHFATGYAIGNSGGYIAWISVLSREFTKLPTYTIAPIRSRDDPPQTVIGGSHISAEEPKIIPCDGLPFSHSVSCIDFDDGHGLLLIGSDAGQICLVNFANSLLPNEAFFGTLPMKECPDDCLATKTLMNIDIPAFYSYRSLPEFKAEECPEFVIEDAVRLWGDAFVNHPPIPGWSSLSQDTLEEILKQLDIEDIYNLSLACSTLHSAILEDRSLWIFILDRDFKRGSSYLPTNAIPVEDAPVDVLRAWVKHAYVLRKAYQHPSLDRAVIRTDTPARVTFVKLARGRWFFVASSDTSVSELSVWEILSPSSCALRTRVYLPAPVLDGILDDDGTYVRLAITVGSCHPTIRILELARQEYGEVLLFQHKEIVGVARILYFRDSKISFACLNGDDTWPTMMDWKNGGRIRLSFSGGGVVGEPFPLTLEYCSGIHVWRSYVMLFAYSGLHIFTLPVSFPVGTTKISPTTSLPLPKHTFDVSFLDECITTDARNRTIANLRWAVYLANAHLVILELSYVEEESLDPSFSVNMILRPELPCGVSNSHYAINYAAGNTGGYVTWISVNPIDFVESPAYMIAPIIAREGSSRAIVDKSRSSVTESKTIPKDCLPFSCSVSCLDFDDGHGILLIGSHAGQFCLVNFTNALLPQEAIHGQLPTRHYTDSDSIPKTLLKLDIPAYYLYRSRPEFESEECPAFAVEDAIRLWGDAFKDHPPIPGWSSDWSKFSLVKEWILPFSLWLMHDSNFSEEGSTSHRVRARLNSFGEITPILYQVSDHARVIIRMGERVLYCRTIDTVEDESTSQMDALGELALTYTEFITADSDTILAHIWDRNVHTNLEDRYSHPRVTRIEYSAKAITYALKEAASIGKVPDEKALEEWSEDDWEKMDRKYAKAAYGTDLGDTYNRYILR